MLASEKWYNHSILYNFEISVASGRTERRTWTSLEISIAWVLPPSFTPSFMPIGVWRVFVYPQNSNVKTYDQ